MPGLNLAFWRKWHRWIAWPATLFLFWAAATGVLVAFTEFFGADEALREATRDMISPVTVSSAPTAWSEPIARAFATAAARTKGAPVDKLEVQFKGTQPTVTVFTGKPTGGEGELTVDGPPARDAAPLLRHTAPPASTAEWRWQKARMAGTASIEFRRIRHRAGNARVEIPTRHSRNTRRPCRRS